MKAKTILLMLSAAGVLFAAGGKVQAALVIQESQGGFNAFPADADDLINAINNTAPTYSGQSNSGGSLYTSDPTGIGLNNGTIYNGNAYNSTGGGDTYCPVNGSSITFTLSSPQDIHRLVSISGGSQARRSQKWRLEFRSGGSFTTIADETQINFVSNTPNGEMEVTIQDELGTAIGTNADQIRVTYFDTGASLPQSMYRELDVFDTASPIPFVQEQLTSTLQIRTETNDPAFAIQDDLAAVNFYYNGPGGGAGGNVGAGTVNGLGFDDIELSGTGVNNPPATTVFNLTANGAGPVMTIDFPFTSNNQQRNQSLNATGSDDVNLETVANEMFYLSSGGSHPTAQMTFTGLGVAPGTELYVQVIGGDSNWSGDIDVTANGTAVGTWTDVADNNGGTAERFAFLTTADGSGDLDLLLTGTVQYSGISAVIVSANAIPEPSTLTLAALGLLGLLGWRRQRKQRRPI